MDKRMGAEGALGLGGGGIVSAGSQRKYVPSRSDNIFFFFSFYSFYPSLEVAEDLCRRGKIQDSVPYLMIAHKDKNNVDADIQMAYLSPDLHWSIEILQDAEARGVYWNGAAIHILRLTSDQRALSSSIVLDRTALTMMGRV
jgi:hypothetical protein